MIGIRLVNLLVAILFVKEALCKGIKRTGSKTYSGGGHGSAGDAGQSEWSTAIWVGSLFGIALMSCIIATCIYGCRKHCRKREQRRAQNEANSNVNRMQKSNIGTPNTDEIWKSPPPDYSEVFSNDNEVKKSGRKSIELVFVPRDHH